MWVYEDKIDICKCQEPMKAPWTSLQKIVERDYPRQRYFQEIDMVPAIDLDGYESQLRRGTAGNQSTMDSAILLQNHREYLLVELRMDYDNPENIRYADIVAKISHSHELLQPNSCCKTTAYIFKQRVADRAKRYFNKLLLEHSQKSSLWDVQSDGEFSGNLMPASRMPYSPVNTESDIRQSLIAQQKKSWKVFASQIDYWLGIMSDYRNKQQLNEVIHIGCVLFAFLRETCQTNPFVGMNDEDFNFEIELLCERLETEFGISAR